MARTSLRLLIAPLAGLLLLGGCFLPGGSAPDGCDLEPNGSSLSARPIDFDADVLSCNQLEGIGDVDVFRLPHADGPGGVTVDCDSEPNASVEILFQPDGDATPTSNVEFTCPDLRTSSAMAMPGTFYVRVHHGKASGGVTIHTTYAPL
jgi:hypothetical protein